MRQLGNFFGSIIVFLYVLTILNYILKFINKNFKSLISKNEFLNKLFIIVMRIIIKYHKVFGIFTIIFILLHFYIQFTYRGISIIGLMSAVTMILQVALGIYGSSSKTKDQTWLIAHRAISIILLVSILIHIN